MPSRLKFNAAVLLALAGLFVFAVYNLSRLRVPLFGLDPCDAVMHFAFFTVVLALVGSLRVLCSYRASLSYQAQNAYFLRSQHAVALAICIAFTAYVVGLARHPSMWTVAGWRNRLFVWLGVFGAVALVMELLVFGARLTRIQPASPYRKSALLTCLLSLAALAFCPEYAGDPINEPAHILSVMVGALVVLLPIGYLLPVLVPSESFDKSSNQVFFNTNSERLALLVGVLLGALLFWIDAHRTEAARRLPALKLIGPVMGVLIVYAFLAEQLGLTSQIESNR